MNNIMQLYIFLKKRKERNEKGMKPYQNKPKIN